MNLVLISGELTKDPEKRMAGSYTVVSLNVLNIEQGAKGKEFKTYVDVTVWGDKGDQVRDQAAQGDKVIVKGRWKTESWDDRQSGQKRFKTVLDAEQVEVIPAGRRVDRAPPPAPEPEPEFGAGDGGSDVPF